MSASKAGYGTMKNEKAANCRREKTLGQIPFAK